MDLSKTPEPDQEEKVSSAEIQKARIIVVAAVQAESDCFWPQIIKHTTGKVSEKAVRAAIKELIAERVIRMRECPYEHDWEYVLVGPHPAN